MESVFVRFEGVPDIRNKHRPRGPRTCQRLQPRFVELLRDPQGACGERCLAQIGVTKHDPPNFYCWDVREVLAEDMGNIIHLVSCVEAGM